MVFKLGRSLCSVLFPSALQRYIRVERTCISYPIGSRIPSRRRTCFKRDVSDTRLKRSEIGLERRVDVVWTGSAASEGVEKAAAASSVFMFVEIFHRRLK